MWTITTGFKKFMRRLFLWLAVIFVVLAVVHVAVDTIVTWQLKSTISKLKADGKLKSIKEIAPPIPDSENAAPLYERVFTLMTSGEGSKHFHPDSWEWKNNKTVDFVLGATWSDLKLWRDDQKKNIPKLIHSPLMQKIYRIIESASRKPNFHPDLDNKNWNDNEVYFYDRMMQSMIKLLFLKAKIEMQAGNENKAADILLSVFRVLKHIQNYQPLFSSSSVTTLYLHAAIDFLEEIERTGKIREEEFADFITILSSFTDLRPLINDWKLGLVHYIDGIEKSMKESYKSSTGYYGFNVYLEAILPDNYKRYVNALLYKFPNLIIMKYKLKIISYYDINVPYYKIAQEIQKIKLTSLQKIILDWQADTVIYDIINPMSFSAHQGRVEVTMLGVALKIYKARHGAYPDSLGALTPEILDKVPSDPFTGKDFIYRKQGNGFLLYSIGPDLRDDRGKPRKRPFYNMDNGIPASGDIVWKSEN